MTGKFKVFAHTECNLNTRKAHSSFVPILFRDFSGYDSHHIFEKLVKFAIEENIRMYGEPIVAKSSETYKSVIIWCLKNLKPYRLFDAR